MSNEAPKDIPKKTVKKPVKSERGKTVLAILCYCIWAFVSVIASELIIGYLMIWILGPERFNKPVWTAVYSAAAYTMALLLTIFVPIALKKKKSGFKKSKDAKVADAHKEKVKRKLLKTETRIELGLAGLPTWSDIALAPIGYIVSLVLATGLVTLFSLFPWFDAEEAQNVGFSLYMSGFDRMIAFLTLVVLAPIAEEIIFRGWLYGKIRDKLNGKMKDIWGMAISILIVSVLFGLIHMQWNVGVNVFALSVVLCGLREVTGTIYAGILTHMVKNGVAFFLLYVVGMQ